jgi:hypothetical protein
VSQLGDNMRFKVIHNDTSKEYIIKDTKYNEVFVEIYYKNGGKYLYQQEAKAMAKNRCAIFNKYLADIEDDIIYT